MGNADLTNSVVAVEHFTAEQGNRGQQRARHAGTITLRVAKSCQLCECGLRHQSVCPLGASSPLWPMGGGDRVLLHHFNVGLGPAPRVTMPSQVHPLLSHSSGQSSEGALAPLAGINLTEYDSLWVKPESVSTRRSTERCVLRCCTKRLYKCPMLVHKYTSYSSVSKFVFRPGKLLFGNDNNKNEGFSACPHVGLSENSL